MHQSINQYNFFKYNLSDISRQSLPQFRQSNLNEPIGVKNEGWKVQAKMTNRHTLSFQLDFQLKDEKGDLGTYVLNGEWDLLGMWSVAEQGCYWTSHQYLYFYLVLLVLQLLLLEFNIYTRPYFPRIHIYIIYIHIYVYIYILEAIASSYIQNKACNVPLDTHGWISHCELLVLFLLKFLQLDLNLKSDTGGDTSTYILNGEWDLIGRVETGLTSSNIHPVYVTSLQLVALH